MSIPPSPSQTHNRTEILPQMSSTPTSSHIYETTRISLHILHCLDANHTLQIDNFSWTLVDPPLFECHEGTLGEDNPSPTS